MNREMRDGEADETKEVRLCKRAMRPPRHIDWGRGLASGGEGHSHRGLWGASPLTQILTMAHIVHPHRVNHIFWISLTEKHESTNTIHYEYCLRGILLENVCDSWLLWHEHEVLDFNWHFWGELILYQNTSKMYIHSVLDKHKLLLIG